jgi:hypothetical protein
MVGTFSLFVAREAFVVFPCLHVSPTRITPELEPSLDSGTPQNALWGDYQYLSFSRGSMPTFYFIFFSPQPYMTMLSILQLAQIGHPNYIAVEVLQPPTCRTMSRILFPLDNARPLARGRRYL